MTEAVQGVNEFLLNNVRFHRIQAHHDTANPASGRVMEKAGMKHEGTLHHRRVRKDGTRADGNVWAIIGDSENKP